MTPRKVRYTTNSGVEDATLVALLVRPSWSSDRTGEFFPPETLAIVVDQLGRYHESSLYHINDDEQS